MTAINTDIYALASRDAALIIGSKTYGRGLGTRAVKIADEDPAAWWCLVELLVSYSRPTQLRERIARLHAVHQQNGSKT